MYAKRYPIPYMFLLKSVCFIYPFKWLYYAMVSNACSRLNVETVRGVMQWSQLIMYPCYKAFPVTCPDWVHESASTIFSIYPVTFSRDLTWLMYLSQVRNVNSNKLGQAYQSFVKFTVLFYMMQCRSFLS